MVGSSTKRNRRSTLVGTTYLNGNQEDIIETDEGTVLGTHTPKIESVTTARKSDTYNLTALRKWKTVKMGSRDQTANDPRETQRRFALTLGKIITPSKIAEDPETTDRGPRTTIYPTN